MSKKELPNIKALAEYRLKGKIVAKGQIVSKKDFSNKSDWRNICSLQPKSRAEETDEKVGAPKAEKPTKTEKPSKAKKAELSGLPGT